jgi:transposase
MQNTDDFKPAYLELLQENTRLIMQIDDLKEQNNYLSDQLNNLKRMIFGQKRERFSPGSSDQFNLFGDAQDVEESAPETEAIAYSRTKNKAHQQQPHFRNPIPDHIPRREIVIEPQGIDTNGLKKIGEEITEELEYEEAKLYVNKYIRPKYAKKMAEGVIIAELPTRIIPKGLPGGGLLAHLIISKFMDHLPIYRLRKQLHRLGVDLSESTINDWLKAIAELLEPLYHLQRARILGRDYLMVDETTIRVLDRMEKGRSHTGYHWVYYDPIASEVFYEYQPGRKAEFPTATLKDFNGFLQTDGYAGYNEVGRRPDVTQLACFAHVRRKFEQALNNDQKRASWMLKRIRYLYLIERRARDRGLSDEERYEFRRRRSRGQLDKMYNWLIKNKVEVVPKSSMGSAIDYTLSLWSRLIRYLDDGRFEIDNNLVENSIRPIAIGRKNYLFAGSHNGARWAAIFYTLLATAELNGLEPKSWFKELLGKIADHPMSRLEELLPASAESSRSGRSTRLTTGGQDTEAA